MKYLADNQMIPEDACLRMIVGTDEEESWRCIRYYLDHAETLPQVSVVPDANFPLLYCEKGLLDFDLTSAETSDEKAEIQIVELKGGRSRNIVPDEASCLLKCEDPEKTAENLELLEQVTVEIADGFLETVRQRDQYTLHEPGKRLQRSFLSFGNTGTVRGKTFPCFLYEAVSSGCWNGL